MKTYPTLLILLLFFASCQKWDLDKQDFINIQITGTEMLSINTVQIAVSISDVHETPVNTHGVIWIQGTEPPNLLLNEGKLSLGIISAMQDTAYQTEISGLLPNKTYTLAAYAIAGTEEFFSEPITIHTGNGEVFSHEVIYEKGSTIELIGQVTGAEAGVLAIAHGFCWSYSNPNPSLADLSVNLGSRQNSNNFSLMVREWPNDSAGHFRAYAILQSGLDADTIYGGLLSFDGDLKDAYTRKSSPGWSKREGAVGFAIGSTGYMGAGRNGSNYLKDFWKYDQATDTWTQIQDLGYPSSGTQRAFAVAFSIGNYGYVGTGLKNSSNQVLGDWWRYNPLSNTWSVAQGAFPGPPRESGVAFVINGKAYVGAGKGNASDLYYGDFYRYDPDQSGGTWTTVASLPSGVKLGHAAGFAFNGRGYFMGGHYFSVSFIVSDKMYKYIPSSGQGTWGDMGSLNLGSRDEAIGMATSTHGYLAGGAGVGIVGGGYFDDLWEYTHSASADEWVKKNSFPFPGRHFMAGFVINDRLYFGTGSDTENRHLDFWEYDPD